MKHPLTRVARLVPIFLLSVVGAIAQTTKPALFALIACVSVTVLVSLTDRSARAAREARAFDHQYVRAVTGLGASGASDH